MSARSIQSDQEIIGALTELLNVINNPTTHITAKKNVITIMNALLTRLSDTEQSSVVTSFALGIVTNSIDNLRRQNKNIPQHLETKRVKLSRNLPKEKLRLRRQQPLPMQQDVPDVGVLVDLPDLSNVKLVCIQHRRHQHHQSFRQTSLNLRLHHNSEERPDNPDNPDNPEQLLLFHHFRERCHSVEVGACADVLNTSNA